MAFGKALWAQNLWYPDCQRPCWCCLVDLMLCIDEVQIYIGGSVCKRVTWLVAMSQEVQVSISPRLQ